MTNELYLPVDTEVKFTVQSKDVIHDFWVPAFREKIDAVPGITTTYSVETTRVGDYVVVCAELCGLGHSAMRQTAHVLPKGEFDSWLNEQRSKAK
jgi:cytochrome c oxidase subunit 2